MVKDSEAHREKRKDTPKMPKEQQRGKAKSNARGGRN